MINHLHLGNCIIKFKFLLHNHESDTFCSFFCGSMQEIGVKGMEDRGWHPSRILLCGDHSNRILCKMNKR